ncbi:DUF3426 domain-containing protein [Psychrobacter sp. SZ93C1]|uniref:DUF3426 domain-containing protein n=1 Tax=Psychrobacter sp. SZ93C1 TaxID=2792058 RepID=UPI0018CEB0A7|nr:DUF3426 domain-containing protein [Psychrobacter sp. SZ93C1]MBH0064996.1 DUF3426 domain-containing protein [Psychrobacter sp. SZ93C1]
MTTPIQTQCPHCKNCLKIQQGQLNKDNAMVICDQCHQRFLVNKHLVVNPDVSKISASPVETAKTQKKDMSPPHSHSAQTSKINNKNSSDNTKSAFKKPPLKKISSDILIHDDMDTDEPDDTSLEYDSLDSMDAWLDQINETNYTSTVSDEPSNTTSKTTSKSISSVVSNDIHANIDDTTDNSWLEKLLKDQNKSEDILQDETDLSRLLLDMGVPLKDEDKSIDERVRKSQEQFIPTPRKRSAASLLWILGCLVLALLLFAQYVIFNLETLVKNPAHAEKLQAICSAISCSLPSADINALTLTNTNHRSSKIKMTGKFSDISATLNNQSASTQLYPNVKVSVYGAETLIGEFIATPADYLLSKQSQLAADSNRQILFTIPVANTQIRDVSISPLY